MSCGRGFVNSGRGLRLGAWPSRGRRALIGCARAAVSRAGRNHRAPRGGVRAERVAGFCPAGAQRGAVPPPRLFVVVGSALPAPSRPALPPRSPHGAPRQEAARSGGGRAGPRGTREAAGTAGERDRGRRGQGRHRALVGPGPGAGWGRERGREGAGMRWGQEQVPARYRDGAGERGWKGAGRALGAGPRVGPGWGQHRAGSGTVGLGLGWAGVRIGMGPGSVTPPRPSRPPPARADGCSGAMPRR